MMHGTINTKLNEFSANTVT